MSPQKKTAPKQSTGLATLTANDKSRLEYLTQWRSGLWTQIRQKEDAIWRFISFYAAAILLAAGFVQPNDPTKTVITPIGILLTILILFIVTFWGLLIVLDANYWEQRNLIFIGNIEREILPASDIGTILPKSYAYLNKFVYSSSYIIHLHILFTTLTISLMAFRIFFQKANLISSPDMSNFSILLSIFFISYLLYLFWKDKEFVRIFAEVRENAPGKITEGNEGKGNINYWGLLLSSPISLWGWSVAMLFLGFTTDLMLNVQIWFPFPASLIANISKSFYALIFIFQVARFFLISKQTINRTGFTKFTHLFIIGLLSLALLMVFILLIIAFANGKIL